MSAAVKDLATLTDDELIRLLRETVKGREDFVYQSPNGSGCFYRNPDGQLGCIFGHALADYGVSEAAGESSEMYADASGGKPIDWILENDCPLVSSEVRGAAATAQGRQDEGSSWGDALDAFEASLVAQGVSA